jgi:metacaspase-1
MFVTHKLIGQFGYKPDDIVMLTDDAPNPVQIPTRQNIVRSSLSSLALYLQ